MEALLKVSGWRPIRSNSTDATIYDTLKQQVTQYGAIHDHPAWLDFQFRLSQIREATRLAIERGGVDQHGQRHDDEQRRVLYVVDTLLSYVPSLKEQLAIIEASQAPAADEKGPIHGTDQLRGSFLSLTNRD